MRSIALQIVFVLVTFSAISQTIPTNDRRIDELPELIYSAKSQENYTEASLLTYELEYRQQFKQAIEEKDYSAAAHWQTELELLLGNSPMNNNNKPIRLPYKERYKDKNFYLNIDFSMLGYSHVKQYIPSWYGNEPASENDVYGPAMNLKVSAKYFFWRKGSSRIGVDLSLISFQVINAFSTASASGHLISPLKPGVVYTYYVGENHGFDVQFNAGIAITNSSVNYSSATETGYLLSPHLRYWLKNVSLGVEYNFGEHFNNPGRYSNVSFTMGMRL
jgi:hypothetical protein